VGKSVVARLLAQWMIDRGRALAAVDCDGSHGVLLRHYAEFTQPADLSSSASVDQIVDRALGAERDVIVDLPAQSARALEAWLIDANVLPFAREMGVGVTYWHVCDGGFASVVEIERALRVLGEQVRHVVVKNYGRTKDFRQFDNSKAKVLLEELGGQLFELSELDASTMYAIDSLGLSFWAAAHGSPGHAEPRPLERQRTKLWLERSYLALNALNGLAPRQNTEHVG